MHDPCSRQGGRDRPPTRGGTGRPERGRRQRLREAALRAAKAGRIRRLHLRRALRAPEPGHRRRYPTQSHLISLTRLARPVRLRDAARSIPRMGPYLLSHHPHCGPFASDTLRVRGRRLCIACLIGYPSMAVTLLALWLADASSLAPGTAWASLGLLLASAQVLSFAGRVPNVPVQVVVKVALGSGLGLFAYGLLQAPFPLPGRLLMLLISLMAIQSLWLLRIRRLQRTCRACPQFSLRPHCEGLADLQRRIGPLLSPSTGKKWIPVDPPRKS